MTDEVNSIVSSPSFKFIVGAEQEEFTIQNALVAHHSKVLGALMNSSYSEKEKGRAYLKDTDPDTFVRFCEFAYTGDYSVPGPEVKITRTVDDSGGGEGADEGIHDASTPRHAIDVVEDNRAHPEVDNWGKPIDEFGLVPEHDSWSSWGTSKYKKKGKKVRNPIEEVDLPPVVSPVNASPTVASQKEKLWNVFRQGLGKSTPPSFNRKEQDSWKDYGEVFLAHARLCQFADERLIDPLAELTTQKLRAVLATAKIYPQQLSAIVSLLEYVYADAKDGRKFKMMRDMVANYAACILEYIKDHDGFQTLLGNKDFSQDLVKYTIMRLE